MKARFSGTWNKSKQPRKQRKYRYNAPLHVKGKFLSVNLSKELRKKYGVRNVRLRTGDKVRVLRGNHKGKEGSVDEINLKSTKVYVTKIELTKKEGAKVRVPINPSNLQILDLNLDDKKRKAKFVSTKKEEENKNG